MVDPTVFPCVDFIVLVERSVLVALAAMSDDSERVAPFDNLGDFPHG